MSGHRSEAHHYWVGSRGVADGGNVPLPHDCRAWAARIDPTALMEALHAFTQREPGVLASIDMENTETNVWGVVMDIARDYDRIVATSRKKP